MSYFEQMFHEANDKIRKKADKDATGILMESIVRQRLLLLVKVDERPFKVNANAPSDFICKLGFLELSNPGQKASSNILKIVNHWDGSELVTEMLQGVSHYGQEHWGDVLLRWLSGKKPLPLCQFISSTGENATSFL